MVLIAETASDADCEQRADKFWRHVLDGCPSCTFRSKACKHELEPRYSRLFEKEPTYTTYVAMTRGNRYERSGRLVVWGLTDRESQWLCGTMAGAIRGKYSGQIECINRRAS